MIILGSIRGSCRILRGPSGLRNVRRWCWWSIVRKCKGSPSHFPTFEMPYPAISPRLPGMLWMLFCNSATPSARNPEPSPYLFLKLLVDLVAICTTTFLRIFIDPVPKYTVIGFRVSISRPLRRLYDRPNAPNISFRWSNSVIIKILQNTITY